MKIAIRFCLIVAFIFSFFFFFTKPINAFVSYGNSTSVQEALSVVNEVNLYMGLTPYCWYLMQNSEYSTPAIVIYYNNYFWTGWDNDLTIRCPMGRYNTTNNLMWNNNYSVLLVKYNSTSKWAVNIDTNKHPGDDTLPESFYFSGQRVNFSYYSYVTRYLSATHTFQDQVFSIRPIFWSPNAGTNNFVCGSNVLCNSIGFSSSSIPIGTTIFGGAPEYLAPPPPKSTFTYFIEYRDNFVSNSWLRLESSKPAYISASWAVGANLFGFDGGEWELYETDGTQRALLDSSSSYYPPYLYIPDVNAPCGSILRSNYSLRDDNGDFVCRATSNPVVDDIAPPFEGKINFVIEEHDWGVFDWLRVPAKILFDAIDGALVWFNDLWRGLLSQLIPMPDFLTYAFQDIKQVADEKFAQIDVSSLKDFRELDPDTMPNITTSLMGVSVTVVNFDLIKPHIDLLRSIMAATVGLFLIIFNVNQVNKLLSDNTVTE